MKLVFWENHGSTYPDITEKHIEVWQQRRQTSSKSIAQQVDSASSIANDIARRFLPNYLSQYKRIRQYYYDLSQKWNAAKLLMQELTGRNVESDRDILEAYLPDSLDGKITTYDGLSFNLDLHSLSLNEVRYIVNMRRREK